MKNTALVFVALIALAITGCKNISHNLNMIGVGKVFKIGGEGYNIMYVNGLFALNTVRENTESIIETNDADVLGNPPDVKTVRAIRFRTGSQVTGYLTDLAKRSPEAAIEYVKVMPSLNKSPLEPVNPQPQKESSSVSKPLTQVVKERLSKIAGSEDYKSPFNGDGTYNKLYQNKAISYQAALCAELLTYADAETEMPTSGETIRETLVHYAGRLAQLKAKGKTESVTILLDRCIVKNGKLAYLMYRLTEEDGTTRDEECPSCFPLED